MANKYWLDGSANWNVAANWTGGTVPGAADDVTVYQGDPTATNAKNVRSLTTIGSGAIDFRSAGASQVAMNVTNGGQLYIDRFGGDGGSSLTIGGTFSNGGTTQIGSANLTANSTVTTAKLVNTGTIELDGLPAAQASLVVGNLAGFGTPASLTGTLRLFGNSFVSFTSGAIRTLANNSYLRLSGAQAHVAIAGNTTSSSALTTLSNVGHNATLLLDNGNTLTDTVSLTNYGSLLLDYFGSTGGASLTLTQKLTNIGYMQIGNGALSAASVVSTGFIDNRGTIELDGNGVQKASLIVDFTAGFGTLYTVTGAVRLFGNSLVQFASGTITTIAANASLRLDGANAFIADAGSTTTNSALTGLRTIDRNATLQIGNGSSIAIANYIDNYGNLEIDYFGGQGGSSMSIAYRLNNVGYLQIGNGALGGAATVTAAVLVNKGTIELDGNGANKASLTVSRAAGFGTNGIVIGTVRLSGNSVVQFASGQINALAAQSYLRLNGTSAFIADAGQTSSNSALKGLRTINTGAQFLLDNGASVSTTSLLNNNGSISLDYFGGEGGASLSVGGRLTNNGYTQVGNGGLSASTTLTVVSVTNSGSLAIYGNGANRASVIVNSVAGTGTNGHLQGSISLQDNALLRFASGQINIIDNGAALRLNGAAASVEYAGNTTLNSALIGLAENDGTLTLDNGADVHVTQGFKNVGTLNLDPFGGEGGSSFTADEVLENDGTIQIGSGSASSFHVVGVGGLVNAGTINIFGNAASSPQGTGLIVDDVAGTGTAGELSGSIYIYNDALLQFASGQITSIAAGASLRLNGVNAFVADASDTTSNSALTGLAQNDGTLLLENGASVTTSGDVSNDGYIYVDQLGGEGSSVLTVGGRLDVEGYLQIGSGGQSADATVAAASLLNNGSVYLYGNNGASHQATLAVTGSVANNGLIYISNDQQTFAGNVTGFGTMSLNNSSILTLNGSVANSQTVDLVGTDRLVLGNAKTFAGSINSFGAGDFLDLTSFAANSSLSYVENAANTAGVLTVSSGANVARLNFDGNFATADFTKASDGSGGLLIGHV